MREITVRNPVIRQMATISSDDPREIGAWLASLMAGWMPAGNRVELFVTPIDVEQQAKNYKPQGSSASRHAPTRHIRAWAKGQGYPVGDRGALPPDIIRAYNRANRGTISPTRAA
jgi:hypothetical protein